MVNNMSDCKEDKIKRINKCKPDLLCNEEDCETYYNYCKKKKTGIVNPFYLFKDGDGV